MRKEQKNSKSSWPKVVVKKWLNIKGGVDDFDSDYQITPMVDKVDLRRGKGCFDEGRYIIVPEEFSEEWLMDANEGIERSRFKQDSTDVTNNNLNLRMFVGTWNVGGKSPHEGLNLKDWLRTPTQPADIYVLGFQEIVPLNAGNVLGAEDSGPADKWLSLIRKALNINNDDLDLHDYQQQPSLKPRVSFSELISLEDELEQGDFKRFLSLNSNSYSSDEKSPSPPSLLKRQDSPVGNQFSLVASKQMVGLFLCVWAREDLCQHISSLRVSCVRRGIMGYLGNKGSISISMRLHQTTFCFVCTHLASGEKEGDEVKRNSDVMEILKKTRFSQSCRIPGKPIPPGGILDHDKIIWLGDLNYRLASGCPQTYELLKNNDWQALLEKDQLKIEQKAGRVFKGWEEGNIYFAPTYKYLRNSDHYVLQTSTTKKKRRIPAWCDRILWKGEGLKQICYVRGESNFSDHRPVYSLFSVLLNLSYRTKPSQAASNPTEPSTAATQQTPGLPSTCVTKVQAEEFLFLTVDNIGVRYSEIYNVFRGWYFKSEKKIMYKYSGGKSNYNFWTQKFKSLYNFWTQKARINAIII